MNVGRCLFVSGCIWLLLSSEIQAQQGIQTALEALTRAEDCVYGPLKNLSGLMFDLTATAKNSDPALGLPKNFEVTLVYQPRYLVIGGFPWGRSENLKSMKTNQPEGTVKEEALSGLKELMSMYNLPFSPVPSIRKWLGQLEQDESTGGSRKLTFVEKQSVVSGWVATEIREPVIWIDGLGRLSALEFEVSEGNLHRVDYEWGPAAQVEKYRLDGLRHEWGSADEKRRAGCSFTYQEIQKRELPVSGRVQVHPAGWTIELRYANYQVTLESGGR